MWLFITCNSSGRCFAVFPDILITTASRTVWLTTINKMEIIRHCFVQCENGSVSEAFLNSKQWSQYIGGAAWLVNIMPYYPREVSIFLKIICIAWFTSATVWVRSCSVTVYDYKYISCVPGVDGKLHPEGVVQHRWWRGLPNHRLAARSPRDGFPHPHQEHMMDTFSCIFYFI